MPSTSRPARRQGSVDMVYAMARTLTTNTAAPPAPAGVPTVNDGSGPADPWKECALEHRVDDVVERTPTDARPTGVSSTDQADHAWDKELSRWKAEEASAGQPVDDQLSDERAYAHVLPYAANQVRKGSPEAAQQKIQPLYMETVFREKEALRQRWFIHPTDPPPNAKGCQQIPRQTWDAWVMISIFYVAYAVPLRLGFNVPVQRPSTGVTISGWFWVDITVDLTFIVDFALNFFTGYYDYSGTLRYTRKDIAINYTGGIFLGSRARGTWLPGRDESKSSWLPFGWMFGWCFWDFWSSLLPLITYTILMLASSQNGNAMDNAKGFRVVRLVRLAKLLRLGRAYCSALVCMGLKRILDRRFDAFSEMVGVLKVLKAILLTLALSHLVACAWHWIGANLATCTSDIDGGNQNLTAICENDFLAGGSVRASCSPATCQYNTWFNGYLRDDDPLATRYVTSIYWATTTLSTVGYGDVTPSNNAEMLFAMFAEVIGTAMLAFTTGTLSSIILGGDEDPTVQRLHENLKKVKEYMRKRKINLLDRRLYRNVMRQVEKRFEHEAADEDDVLDLLPTQQAVMVLEICKGHEMDLLKAAKTATFDPREPAISWGLDSWGSENKKLVVDLVRKLVKLEYTTPSDDGWMDGRKPQSRHELVNPEQRKDYVSIIDEGLPNNDIFIVAHGRCLALPDPDIGRQVVAKIADRITGEIEPRFGQIEAFDEVSRQYKVKLFEPQLKIEKAEFGNATVQDIYAKLVKHGESESFARTVTAQTRSDAIASWARSKHSFFLPPAENTSEVDVVLMDGTNGRHKELGRLTVTLRNDNATQNDSTLGTINATVKDTELKPPPGASKYVQCDLDEGAGKIWLHLDHQPHELYRSQLWLVDEMSDSSRKQRTLEPGQCFGVMSAMHMSDPKNPKGNETLSTETVIPWIRKDLGDQVTLFVLKSEDLLEVLENADAKATGTWEEHLEKLRDAKYGQLPEDGSNIRTSRRITPQSEMKALDRKLDAILQLLNGALAGEPEGDPSHTRSPRPTAAARAHNKLEPKLGPQP